MQTTAMTLRPMIAFSGNCRQAMEFYRECFGGTLDVQGLSDDVKSQLPENMRDIVLRAKLTTSFFTLLASDLGQTTAPGRIALVLESGDREIRKRVFRKLSGTETADPEPGETAATIDPFGVEWLFNF
ncbi:VOC family protein [Flavobacterium selenitireducens]|uniref:hypothetical protein n=1 Tax=Flavobacterium selenitireducens TaxID=2722704 RepID=UPI00168A8A31|nr:hypothetical protein [Flavobacterium selenitireducens]MBD3581342.1 hypothetical protein [Flavobacterium selenitireducens]